MDMYTATETAYKNGYNTALKDFLDNITNTADLIRINDFDSKWTISSDELERLKEKLTKI